MGIMTTLKKPTAERSPGAPEGGPHGVAVGGPGLAGAQRQGGRRHLSAAPVAQPPRPAPGCRAHRPGPPPQHGAHASPQRHPRGRQSAGRRAAARRSSAHHTTTRRVSRAPLPLVPAGPPDGAPGARPRGRPGPTVAVAPGPGRAPRAHTPPERPPAGSRGAVTPAPPRCARGPPARGWPRLGACSPKTRAPKAARRRDCGGEDSTGLPHPGLSALGQQASLQRRRSKLKIGLCHHSR